MQYQSTSSYRCGYTCSSSSPPCQCYYSYCQPHRHSNSAQVSHTTTIYHHYHYLPHPSISSPSSSPSTSPPTTLFCQQYCHNIPTCMAFSPTKNHQPCKCKSSTSNDLNVAPISPITFNNPRHQQHEKIDPKKYKLLTHSIQELIQSERDYVEDLYIMVEICLSVLQQQKWASTRHVAIMSRNSSDILAFHHRVLSALNTCTNKSIEQKCQTISQTFLDHQSEFMTLYVDYCDGHSKAWSLCTEYRAKSEWPDFILQCQSLMNYSQENNTLSRSSSNKRIRFEDFLIKPIQRICRYQLLLKEIIKHINRPSITSSPSSSSSSSSSPPSSSSTSLSSANISYHHSILTQAFKCMHHIATEIDRQNEKKEYQERTYRFIQRLESDWRLSRHRVAQLGCLVISGALDIQYYTTSGDTPHHVIVGYTPHPHDNTTDRPSSFPSPPPSPINAGAPSSNTSIKSRYLGCFVFPSYIIMVQVKKQTLYEAKHWFPLHIVDLVDQENENEFLLQCHEHIFVCNASCLREKQTWIDKIRSAQQLIRQQQQQKPEGIVSSLSSHSFSSTQLVTSHHQQSILRSSTAFFLSDNHTYQYFPRRSSKNESLPSSSSSPSLLLPAGNEQSRHSKIKKNRSLSTHFTTSSSTTKNYIPSSSPPLSPTFLPSYQTNHPHTSTGKQQPPRRHSSLDLFTMATHNLNRVSLHFKTHHRNAIRDAVDQRIRDVCTRDYLSSRARHLALDRKLSTTHTLPPASSSTTASPLMAATTLSASSVSPSPSPSTPLPNTITSSSAPSSPLLISTSGPYHSLHNRVPSPTLYPVASSPLPMHQTPPTPSLQSPSLLPCRSRRSNPKSPLMPSSHNHAGGNDDRESKLDPSRKPSSITVTELSPHHSSTTKKGHRRVSRLLQSLWHRLSRTKKRRHHQGSSFMTKMEIPSPHRSAAQTVLASPRGSTTSKMLHPMRIQEEQEDTYDNRASITMH